MNKYLMMLPCAVSYPKTTSNPFTTYAFLASVYFGHAVHHRLRTENGTMYDFCV